MKKQVLLYILFAMIAIRVVAQVEKNTILLGGNATIKVTTAESAYFIINPSSGLFLTDKICLGITAPVMYIDEEFAWGVTPFGRYYFSPEKNQSIYARSSLGLSHYDSFYVNLSMGIGNVWFINKNVGIEAELAGMTDFSDFGAGLFIGFQIYFNSPEK